MADRYYRLSVLNSDQDIGLWVSTFHYRVVEADDPGPNDLCATWWSVFQDHWDDGLAVSSFVTQVHAVEVPNSSVAPPLPAVGDAFVTDAGERTVDRTIDGGLCARATLHTGISGRRHRGGLYSWPVLDKGSIIAPESFYIPGAFWAAWIAMLNLLLANNTLVVSGKNFTWVVYSPKAASLNQTPGQKVLSYVADPTKQYWLRRREKRNQ